MTASRRYQDEPLTLIVPGFGGSGADHWQTHWESEQENCHRVELGMWEAPQTAIWADRLGSAISEASRPLILVAHSLGCHAVAWWNMLERSGARNVLGALLVAPPDVENVPFSSALSPFAPVVRARLPFPSILVASRNDPWANYGESKRMARIWGSRLIDAGPLGHINADSGIRNWPYGKFLLRRLISATAPSQVPLLHGGAIETLSASAGSIR